MKEENIITSIDIGTTKIAVIIAEKNNNSLNIILGSPGGVATECLQTYKSVYHITKDPFDVFCPSIWNMIKTFLV